MRNRQRNLTITNEQVEALKLNFGKMNIPNLAKLIGEPYGKTHSNLRLLGYVTPRETTAPPETEQDGYFNLKEFAKMYAV
jgi:hypothetical protein